MRAEFAGVTGAIGVGVVLSYAVIASKSATRQAALGAWSANSNDFRFVLWSLATLPTAAFFLLLWYDVAFSGTETEYAELIGFTVFLLCALLFSIGILELQRTAAIRAVWLTAIASFFFLFLPMRSSSNIPTAWLWVAASWVVFHHVFIDGWLWALPLQ
ncbi:MAG: hypothetical protein CL678_00645 [Bdellovibrionaceae bacterium]|nr:hypothetical protein [Pseudobdellovibrionaceae bacterium]|tara:strand:+ start:5466 stop:5942 length:477 start_codon:yes stop_codon:yes gene_type:complete